MKKLNILALLKFLEIQKAPIKIKKSKSKALLP